MKRLLAQLLKKKEVTYHNNGTHNDRWAVEIFKRKKHGFFIEAGALDGIHGSCTYTLEKYFKWRGILVEPGIPYTALVKNRPGAVCENICLAGKSGSVVFVDSKNSGYSGIKEKLIAEDAKHKEKWGKTRENWKEEGFSEKIIEAVTFQDLLIKHNAPEKIDYVAFDMEGSELNVLENFPFDEYHISAFSIEGDSCNELLLSNGYRQVKNPYNIEAPWESYFIHKSF